MNTNTITVNETITPKIEEFTFINKKEQTMKTSRCNHWRFVLTAILILAISAVGWGQNLILTSNSNVTGTGIIKVKGNISDSAAAGAVTLHGAVWLTGTGLAQSIGGGGTTQPLTFDTLRSDSTGTKTMTANVTAAKYFTLNNGTVIVNGKTLTIGDAVSHASGVLTASGASDSVAYTSGTTMESIIEGTYNKLGLSGTAPKNLFNAVTVNANVRHTGGGLTVNKPLTVAGSGAYGFTTIDSIGASGILTLSTAAGNITTLSDVRSGGQLVNGSGALTVGTVTNNHGTITSAVNGGPMTFTAFTTNNGTITGGAGLVTFTGALVDSNSTITPGAGDMLFSNAVTLNGGTLTSPLQADSIRFANNLTVNTGATFSLSGTGVASIGGTFTRAGTGLVSYASTSSMTYNGTAQPLAPANYGNLILGGTGIAVGNTQDSVQGNLTLNQNLTMNPGDSLLITQAASAVSGTGEVTGKVTRNHLFASGTSYSFNRDSVSLALNAAVTRTVTMNMQPATYPTDTLTLGTQNYVKRRFAISGNWVSGDQLSKLMLHYGSGEILNSADSTHFGIQSDSSTNWSKVTNSAGGMTRSTPYHAVVLSGLASPLVGVSEFAVTYTAVMSIASTDWNLPGTWDDGIPHAYDDVIIRHAVTLGTTGMVAKTVTINSTKSLTFSASGSLTVTGLFNLNSGASGGLTLAAGNTLTVNGGNIILNGPVTNAGIIDVH
ncbi:MAG: beta strand repeat-containing protein [Bacteroidota bacterium]